MEITNHVVDKMNDPTGIIEGDRYEFLLDVEVEEDDELFTEGGWNYASSWHWMTTTNVSSNTTLLIKYREMFLILRWKMMKSRKLSRTAKMLWHNQHRTLI